MNAFEVRDGALWCEDVALETIAHEVGTPVYVYSTATLERHYRVFEAALAAHPGLGRPEIAYAVKANSNLSVLATLARLGAGADTVSEFWVASRDPEDHVARPVRRGHRVIIFLNC